MAVELKDVVSQIDSELAALKERQRELELARNALNSIGVSDAREATVPVDAKPDRPSPEPAPGPAPAAETQQAAKQAPEVLPLREWRSRMGLKQMDLCYLTKIPVSYLSDYELGKETPVASDRKAIAEALGVEESSIQFGFVSRPGVSQDRQYVRSSGRRMRHWKRTKIWEFRRILGITQRKLGEMAEIGNHEISRYELGASRPSRDALARIASSLGVSVQELGIDPYDGPRPGMSKNGNPPVAAEESKKQPSAAPRIKCAVAVLEMKNEDGVEIPAVRVRCSRCDRVENCFGTGGNSVRRCFALLRENCPRKEQNFYFDPDGADKK